MPGIGLSFWGFRAWGPANSFSNPRRGAHQSQLPELKEATGGGVSGIFGLL